MAPLSCGHVKGGAVGPGAGATETDELDDEALTLGATVLVIVPAETVETIVVVSWSYAEMVNTFGLPVSVAVTVGPAKFWQAHALEKDADMLASEPWAFVCLRKESRASAICASESAAGSGAAFLALKPALPVTVTVAAGTVVTLSSVNHCVVYVE